MAVNAASHNPTGEATGPIAPGGPPQASSEVIDAILASAEKDPLGQHAGGQDGGDRDPGREVMTDKERKEGARESGT